MTLEVESILLDPLVQFTGFKPPSKQWDPFSNKEFMWNLDKEKMKVGPFYLAPGFLIAAAPRQGGLVSCLVVGWCGSVVLLATQSEI